MSITKKAKKVNVLHKETRSYYSSYDCPSCHTIFANNGPRKDVIRFRCECGQELIVGNHLFQPLKNKEAPHA